MTLKEMDILAKEGMDAWVKHGEKDHEQRTLMLNHIEDLRSKEYREAVEECLEECESQGRLNIVDISTIKGNRQEENYSDMIDHIYVNQTTNGGHIGDEFAGYVYIPITKHLYLKSYYSM